MFCKIRFLLIIGFIIISHISLRGGTFIELSPAYNIPIGEWNDAFGKGFCFGGSIGFSFSEYMNPEIGGFLIFPQTGDIVENEYKIIHSTESVSLFTATAYIYLGNRIDLALSEKTILSFEVGYGIHSQRDYASVPGYSYESIDNFSGHGPFIGFGLKKKIELSVFDYIQPFLKLYYSQNNAYYLIVDTNSSVDNFNIADKRIGLFVGITLTSVLDD